MGNLIKNEVSMFLCRKNVICFLVGLFSILLIYQFQYMNDYKSFSNTRQYELQENMKDIDIYAKAYQVRLERLRKEFPGHKKTPEAELMAKVWSTYSIMTKNLQMYWKWPERYDQQIHQAERLLDDQLVPVSEQKIEVGITNLFRNTEREWKQRMLLFNAYEQEGREVPNNKAIPTGAYVINDALSGTSLVFLLLIILLIIWNFDSWAVEFEQSTYRVLFTLPYSRKILFLTRFFVRYLLSMIGTCILLVALFLCGALRYGVGGWANVIVNKTAIESMSFFNTDMNSLMRSDMAESIGFSISLRVILTILFFVFLVAIIQLLSLFIKNQMGTLIIIAVGVMSVVTYTLFPKASLEVGLVPILYFQNANALNGSLGIGILLIGVLLMVCTALILFISMIWLEKCEI